MNTNMYGYQAYQKNKYETASPHRLITMLYEGAIRFLNQAIKMLDEKDIVLSNKAILRAQDIIYELIACLNFEQGKEIAENLDNLYRYTLELTMKANINKDATPLYEAIKIFGEIKEAWEQIGKDVSINHA